jgi:chromosome segregation ATPase
MTGHQTGTPPQDARCYVCGRREGESHVEADHKHGNSGPPWYRSAPPQDGDEIERAFETLAQWDNEPEFVTALATIQRTVEGLRAKKNEFRDELSKCALLVGQAPDVAAGVERALREATSRAEQAEAERDALRLTARQNKWYAERRDEDVSRLTRQLDEMESDYEDLRSSALKHDRETSAIHGDMLALGRALGVPYDGQKSPAGYLHADIMPALREATSRAEQAEAALDKLRDERST